MTLDEDGNMTQIKPIEPIQWQDIKGSQRLTLIALSKENKVYTWGGDNFYGGLGDGTDKEYSDEPICLSEIETNPLYRKEIIQIDSNGETHIVLDKEGKVYTWGSNDLGELGAGNDWTEKGFSNLPICLSEIESNPLYGKKIITVGCNEVQNSNPRLRTQAESRLYFAIEETGDLYVWGSNFFNEIGVATIQTTVCNQPICLTTIEGSSLYGKKISKIKHEAGHVLALDNEGKVYTWGWNYEGKLGDGTDKQTSNTPICISDIEQSPLKGKTVVEIEDCAVIDSEGKVYTWGSNGGGKLGDGTDKQTSNLPICISDIETSALKGKKITQISTSKYGYYRYAIDESGKVYSWGANDNGALGDGTSKEFSNLPICISDIEGNIIHGKTIKQAIAHYNTAILLDNDGNVYQMKYENEQISVYGQKINRICALSDSNLYVFYADKNSYIEEVKLPK